MKFNVKNMLVSAMALGAVGCSGGGGGGGGGGTLDHSLGMMPNNPTEMGGFDKGKFGAGSLAAAMDWRSLLPPIGDQGSQGSCVGWSSAYYVKSALEAQSEGWDTTAANHQYSPSWVYNQINGGQDGGSLPSDAVELMVNSGAATLATMAYDQNNFTNQPSAAAIGEAANFKNTSWQEYATFDFAGLTNHLANAGPVVLGIQVYRNFYDATTDYTSVSGDQLGGHAIACVGYDVDRNGGSLLLANSWASSWGDQGFTYVSKDAMAQIYLGAWTMTDGPNTGGGGGGALPAPTNFQANAWDNLVELSWDRVAAAFSYHIERRPAAGTWRGVADMAGSDTFYEDLDVEADTDYEYRIASVAEDGTTGSFATLSTSTTGDGGGNASLTVTATNSQDGNAFPDMIQLSWQPLAATGLLYVVLRSNGAEDFATGDYDIVFYDLDVSGYEDLVSPGSSYAYVVLVLDEGAYSIVAESEIVRGSTSGAAGGFDLWILDSWGDIDVWRGTTAAATMQVGNWTETASPNQHLRAGVEYYFWDMDLWGILEFADAENGSVPIFDVASNTSIPAYDGFEFNIDPLVPTYLITDPYLASHWWVFEVMPLDASGQPATEIFEDDNVGWTWDELVVY